MSYILEALKKSDKERQRDEIPDLQADHSLPPLRRQEKKPSSYRMFVVLIAGLACAGSLWYWLSERKTAAPVNISQQIASAPAPAPAPVGEKQPSVKSQPAEKPVVVPVVIKEEIAKNSPPLPVETIPSPPPISPETKTVVPLMEDLPLSIRAGIPDLTFAGHVYSDLAKKRLIIINNRIVREGDLIDNGLSLEQIDSDGVVLRYERSVFRVKLF